jgi:hypothetical protein
MDSFQICLAFGPVALYLLLVAAVNMRGCPTVVSGMRDMTVLALALTGLAAVGPMEIAFPESAALNFLGARVWAPLFALYGLCVVLVLLSMRPRMIVYNITSDQMRHLLAEAVDQLDGEARWAGDSLFLPQLGVQLHLDAARSMRNVSLVSSGPNQNHLGWLKLRLHLARAVQDVRTSVNGWGIVFGIVGLCMIACMVSLAVSDLPALAQGMHDMFRV